MKAIPANGYVRALSSSGSGVESQKLDIVL